MKYSDKKQNEHQREQLKINSICIKQTLQKNQKKNKLEGCQDEKWIRSR